MRKKRVLSEEHKRKISQSQKGSKKVFSRLAIENIRKAASKRKGIPTGPMPEETKAKIRIATTGKKKTIINDNPTWFKKGNVPDKPFNKGHIPWNKGKKWSKEFLEKFSKSRIKKDATSVSSFNYRQWKKAVFERDNYTCRKCSTNECLHAHHIKKQKEFPELRFDVCNGLTLCRRCHSYLHGKENCCVRNGVLFKKGEAPWNKGKNLSAEHCEKLSKAHIGKTAWNKGLRLKGIGS